MSGGTKVVHLPEVVTEEKTRHIPLYRVLVHNDDKTHAEFVVFVLLTIFKKEMQEAIGIMNEAHTTGCALVIVEPLERAEFHVEQVKSLARPRGFPLALSMEPE